MVNRVLIRIKVVQMLYCYLLSQSDFKMASAPDQGASKDNRYAYSLYVALLMMIMEMSGMDVRAQGTVSPLASKVLPKLAAAPLTRSLSSIDALRQAIARDPSATRSRFDAILPQLYQQLQTLPAYKSYLKIARPAISDDVTLWLSVLENLVDKNRDFVTVARQNPDFTYTGFHRGVRMLTEMLRNYGDNRLLFSQSRAALDHSLAKAHELYVSLLELPLVLTRAQEQRLEDGRRKYLPTDADLHPNTRLVDNAFAAALRSNASMRKALEGPHMDWNSKQVAVDNMLDQLLSSDIYQQYLALPDPVSWQQDCDLWLDVMKTLILPGDTLAEMLEGQSVYWNDDLHIVGDFLMKTLRRVATSKTHGADVELLPTFKDKDDRDFGPDLFRNVAEHHDEYRAIINEFINPKAWSSDRLALMDVVIMSTAIAEMLSYPQIPVGVTVNEYVDIANAYSTPGSGAFVNGVLRAAVNRLRQDGRLQK